MLGLTAATSAVASSSQECGTVPLEELASSIKAYDDGVFKKKQLRKVLEKSVDSALYYTKRSEYKQAVRVLVKSVLPKVDGCRCSGSQS